jgi:hypothetical protein
MAIMAGPSGVEPSKEARVEASSDRLNVVNQYERIPEKLPQVLNEEVLSHSFVFHVGYGNSNP